MFYNKPTTTPCSDIFFENSGVVEKYKQKQTKKHT